MYFKKRGRANVTSDWYLLPPAIKSAYQEPGSCITPGPVADVIKFWEGKYEMEETVLKVSISDNMNINQIIGLLRKNIVYKEKIM